MQKADSYANSVCQLPGGGGLENPENPDTYCYFQWNSIVWTKPDTRAGIFAGHVLNGWPLTKCYFSLYTWNNKSGCTKSSRNFSHAFVPQSPMSELDVWVVVLYIPCVGPYKKKRRGFMCELDVWVVLLDIPCVRPYKKKRRVVLKNFKIWKILKKFFYKKMGVFQIHPL